VPSDHHAHGVRRHVRATDTEIEGIDMGGSYLGSTSGNSSPSRVIRLRSECDDNELIIEEFGEKRPITVSTSTAGVVVGCTRMSWRAWNYIKEEVGRQRG